MTQAQLVESQERTIGLKGQWKGIEWPSQLGYKQAHSRRNLFCGVLWRQGLVIVERPEFQGGDGKARRIDNINQQDHVMGNKILKVVFFPGSLVKFRVPPCLSTMIEWAMASPWPLPLPISFVVKNGSKIKG